MVQTRQNRRATKGKAVAREEGLIVARGRVIIRRGSSSQGRPHQETVAVQDERRERVFEPAQVLHPGLREGVGPSGGNATSRVGQREDAMASLMDQLLRTQQQQAATRQQQEQLLRRLLQDFAPQQSQYPPPPPLVSQQEYPPVVDEAPESLRIAGPSETPVTVMALLGREAGNRVAFMKEKPPSFQGGVDPEAATSWIGEMEKIFAFLQCTDAEKVCFATYMLREGEHRWWTTTVASLDVEHHPLTWAAFVKVFYDHYFPLSVRNIRRTKFANLR